MSNGSSKEQTLDSLIDEAVEEIIIINLFGNFFIGFIHFYSYFTFWVAIRQRNLLFLINKFSAVSLLKCCKMLSKYKLWF